MASGWAGTNIPAYQQFKTGLQNSATQQNIGRYGAPPSPGGQPDFSFLDPNSPNFNAALYQQAYGQPPGTSNYPSSPNDATAQAIAQRDAALQQQYGGLLNANNLYGQQQEDLQRAGIGSAEQYGAANSQIQQAGINSAEKYGQAIYDIQYNQLGQQVKQALFGSGQQTRAQESQSAASGSTVSQGNRQALSDINTQLQFTMNGLYAQLQQLGLGNQYRKEQEYQQMQGIGAADLYRQQTEAQQLQGIDYAAQNRQANYGYQQAQNQTAIQDLLQPYAGLTP